MQTILEVLVRSVFVVYYDFPFQMCIYKDRNQLFSKD